MKLFESFETMLDRMTTRERRLFGALVAALLAVVVGAGWLTASTVFGSIQADVDHGREVMAQLRQIAPRYMEAFETRRQAEEAIRSNRQTIRSSVNEILKKIELSQDVPGAVGATMADIVSFEGKTSETPVELGRSRKKPAKAKGKEVDTGFKQVDQSLEFRDVPVPDLMRFLDTLEKGKDLFFVTKFEATRKFNNKEFVRASVSISTVVATGEAPEAPSAATPAE
jgi:hypothetical protein